MQLQLQTSWPHSRRPSRKRWSRRRLGPESSLSQSFTNIVRSWDGIKSSTAWYNSSERRIDCDWFVEERKIWISGDSDTLVEKSQDERSRNGQARFANSGRIQANGG